MKGAARLQKGRGEHGQALGVGGRQARQGTAARGGGYPDFYKKFARAGEGAACDARLDELREIGLSRAWLTLAEVIGVDAFLEVWKVLDGQAEQVNPGERELYVPLFRSYLRFQRNRFILALARQGTGIPEIRKVVRETLCEEVSARHIMRIIAKFKIQPE